MEEIYNDINFYHIEQWTISQYLPIGLYRQKKNNNIIFSPWSKREIYNDIRISEIYFIHSIHIFDMEEIYNDINFYHIEQWTISQYLPIGLYRQKKNNNIIFSPWSKKGNI